MRRPGVLFAPWRVIKQYHWCFSMDGDMLSADRAGALLLWSLNLERFLLSSTRTASISWTEDEAFTGSAEGLSRHIALVQGKNAYELEQ